jgi:aminopeptidase-like protein
MPERLSAQLSKYFDRLWPLHRSITGQDARRTHQILKEIIPLKTFEIPSGLKVHDWKIPREWNIKEAYILTPEGKKICDIKKNNLHILNYSSPVNKTVSLKELQKNLFSIKKLPKAIPYLTSYYGKNWGFCIQDNVRKKLKPGKYKVLIKSKFTKGSLTISEKVLKGKSKKEILFTTYTCHPSMANNELSGPLVQSFLYKKLLNIKNRYFTYRFVFHPETIGSITYLFKKGKYLKKNVVAAYNLTCLGLKNSKITYKKSKTGNSLSDFVALKMLKNFDKKRIKVLNFFPSGSDERQYCSPGYNLPMGVFLRGVPGTYKEYHTSLDNKKILSIKVLIEMINIYFRIIKYFEINRYELLEKKSGDIKKNIKKKGEFFLNLKPFCEPHLSKINLHETIGGKKIANKDFTSIQWLLSYSDGENSIQTISKKSGIKLNILKYYANLCCKRKLLKRIK